MKAGFRQAFGGGRRKRVRSKIIVFIPFRFRRRNGWPKILPSETEPGFQGRSQDPHILRAVGRAWAWRRRLESGEVATILDIATMEKESDRFVSRMFRLAYLSRDVLERLLTWSVSPSVTVNELARAASLPWAEQVGRALEG